MIRRNFFKSLMSVLPFSLLGCKTTAEHKIEFNVGDKVKVRNKNLSNYYANGITGTVQIGNICIILKDKLPGEIPSLYYISKSNLELI